MSGGKTFGALTIYSREPIGFADEEVKLLTDLASDFAQGITTFRSRAARERAEQAVRESEEPVAAATRIDCSTGAIRELIGYSARRKPPRWWKSGRSAGWASA